MQKKISIFSFFSGIGILDLAFEKNGYNIVFVNEYDNLFIKSYQYARMQMNLRAPIYGYRNDSAERYARRRGKKNLLALIAQEREKGNLVGFIGGPPCPDFSVAGKNAGVDGENYVFYLYKLYLEYRGRQPFQTINLIRQEDTSLPVMYNKEKTGQYLSFRSIPIPDKSNRKNWCWVIDAAELNRVLMLLRLPTLRDGNDDIVLKDESVELRLEQNKKIRIVKAKEKVRFEAV